MSGIENQFFGAYKETMKNTSSAEAPVAVITGGSRGLGKSMALHLADAGVDVVITYLTGEKQAAEVVDEIRQKGRRGAALQLDVAKAGTFAAFTSALRGALSAWKKERFDFLVNNAGSGVYASFMQTTEAQFDDMVNVHLKSTFFLTQHLAPLLADGGRILNVSTGLTRFSFPGYSAYATVKGGVEVLTHYLAKELGERRISVNTLAPGAIETDFGGGAVRDNAQLNQGIAAQTALGRVGLPDDIGGAVAMLLSPHSKWLNGQRIEFAGGMLL
jgi:NAD(P)-dependent dehydrogenase (short-subunit alcohol dehydrogenase family)